MLRLNPVDLSYSKSAKALWRLDRLKYSNNKFLFWISLLASLLHVERQDSSFCIFVLKGKILDEEKILGIPLFRS
jgi:hypothetical protein